MATTTVFNRDALVSTALTTVRGTCLHPHEVYDETGNLIAVVKCASSNARRRPHCADLYSGDVRQILYDGIAPDRLDPFADPHPPHEFWFLTLTGPSFGKVHRGCHEKGSADTHHHRTPCTCGSIHCIATPEGQAWAGLPLDLATYDYAGMLRFNRGIGRLWNATKQKLRYYFPHLEYAVLREWQARGTLHLHIMLRMPAFATPSERFTFEATVRQIVRNTTSTYWVRSLDPTRQPTRAIQAAATRAEAKEIAAKLGLLTPNLERRYDVHRSDDKLTYYVSEPDGTLAWGTQSDLQQIGANTAAKLADDPDDDQLAAAVNYAMKAVKYSAKSLGSAALKASDEISSNIARLRREYDRRMKAAAETLQCCRDCIGSDKCTRVRHRNYFASARPATFSRPREKFITTGTTETRITYPGWSFHGLTRVYLKEQRRYYMEQLGLIDLPPATPEQAPAQNPDDLANQAWLPADQELQDYFAGNGEWQDRWGADDADWWNNDPDGDPDAEATAAETNIPSAAPAYALSAAAYLRGLGLID